MSSSMPLQSPASEQLTVRPRHGIAAVPGVESTLETGQAAQSFSFSDFLSVINPLQHIPIVGTIYRAVTGDTIAPAARVLGGALFGGPIGLLTSAFNAVIEQTTGKDLGDQALALVVPGIEKPPSAAPMAAQFATAAVPAGTAIETEVPAATATPASADATPALASPTLSARNGQDGRALSAALASRQRIATDGSTASGRTLADYRSFAGRPLPTIDSTRTASSATPVRLQTTGPITPERGRAPVLPASIPASNPTSGASTTPSDGAPSGPPIAPTATDGSAGSPPTHWFQAAMMKGLDRYRDSRKPELQPAQQVDRTL